MNKSVWNRILDRMRISITYALIGIRFFTCDIANIFKGERLYYRFELVNVRFVHPKKKMIKLK